MLILVWNCKPSEPYVYVCHDGLIDYEKVESLRHFQSIINPNDSLVTLVIRTDEDYKKYIVDRQEKIDFSNKTLLAGRIRTPMSGYIARQSVKSYCISGEIYFDVQYVVNKDGITVFSEVPFYAIIPKISEETKVRFIIHP
ncbi:hypothetical protein [Dyadobacter frigoris]|uniref:Uncharacterized protein n=2 Tax=Dyadobacter frigoris TaxID=2576211 RepID=A0A4U6D8S5_9BACT|nr:hypothetical protein [Dyadobacter frigoris]TKT90594.1 hypothetical protein FDK13_19925 [Dyadobacter frigoris]GLU51258.1 hypothetical protein Dfri01_07190 [Dyadobacter frigoris]